jgi:hypothetical protein
MSKKAVIGLIDKRIVASTSIAVLLTGALIYFAREFDVPYADKVYKGYGG